MTNYSEVKSDYIDDQNMCIIDAYKTDDGMEDGRQIAGVCCDTGKVVFFNNDERSNPQIRKAICEVLAGLTIAEPFKSTYLKTNIEYFSENIFGNAK